jgi:hypothetical protein
MTLHAGLFLAAVSALACAGCSVTAPSAHQIEYSVPKQPADLVKQYYRDVVWRLPEKGYEFAFLLDGPTFIAKHRDEMLKTLEVVETVEVETIAASFVRYSIGGDIYRQVRWLRKVDGAWYVSQRTYYSSFGDDPFNDGNPERAKQLLNRTNQWEKDSAPIWW